MLNIFKRKQNPLPKKTWKDITLAAHKRILEVYDKYRFEEDDSMMLYDLVTAVYGWPPQKIEEMTISEANQYVDTIAFLGEKPKPVTAKGSYILNGKKYKTCMDLTRVTTAQYIDFQQMADKSGEMPAEFLSIILIPEGKTYNNGYDLSEAVEDIRYYLTVEEALGLTAFFFDLLRISMKRSTALLKKLIRKARKEGKMTEEQLNDLQKVQNLLTECANGMKPLTL